MANAVYPKALKAFLDADIDMLVDDIRILLVDSADYTYSAAHQYVSDVGGTAIVARSPALTTKTTTGGVFDCDDTTAIGVTGDSVEDAILYQHTGSDATARVIAFFDHDSVGGTLSLTPDGGNVNITMPAGGLISI